MIKPEIRSGYKELESRIDNLLVCSSYFSSSFKFCVYLSNKSRMFVMKFAFLV